MEIPKELIEKWERLKSQKDADKIAELANVTPATVRNAFVRDYCSDEVFLVMAKFYKEKEELVKQYI